MIDPTVSTLADMLREQRETNELLRELVAVQKEQADSADRLCGITDAAAANLEDRLSELLAIAEAIEWFTSPRWLRWRMAWNDARERAGKKTGEKITVLYGHYPDEDSEDV